MPRYVDGANCLANEAGQLEQFRNDCAVGFSLNVESS